MPSTADTPYLANLDRWRHTVGMQVPPAPTVLADVSDDLRTRVAALETGVQQCFLAWHPLVAPQVARRPALLHELIDLVTSGRAQTSHEFELALAFTTWTAESPDAPWWIGPDEPTTDLSGEEFTAFMEALEQGNRGYVPPSEFEETAEKLDAADYAEHEDHLRRLHELFARAEIPWQALDMWFVVFDDTNPLFDDLDLLTRRAAVLHAILTTLPDTFTISDVLQLSDDAAAVSAALTALEDTEIVQRDDRFSGIRWYRIATLDDLRLIDQENGR